MMTSSIRKTDIEDNIAPISETVLLAMKVRILLFRNKRGVMIRLLGFRGLALPIGLVGLGRQHNLRFTIFFRVLRLWI